MPRAQEADLLCRSANLHLRPAPQSGNPVFGADLAQVISVTFEHIQDVYSRTRRSWPSARTSGELKREIALLDDLLVALRGSQIQGRVRDLSEQISDLQDTLRLELAGRGAQDR